MSRTYTLTTEFKNAFEIDSAIVALEVLLPEDEEHSVQIGADIHTLACSLFDACLWSKDVDGSRPSIMPTAYSEEELQDWRQAIHFLRLSAECLEEYIDRENKEMRQEQ